jgi:biopolymer transport protein TolR
MGANMSGGGGKKDLNFEINLLPVFDILSVCICFLLMTVVWTQVGALNASQGVGAQSQADTKPSTSLWLTLQPNQSVQVIIKAATHVAGQYTIASQHGTMDLQAVVNQIAKSNKTFKITQAVVIPSATTRYADVVSVMDRVRGAGIQDVGLTPL